jgi:hypothetical protein
MMNLDSLYTFDEKRAEESAESAGEGSYGPLPRGEYTLEIVESEIKETKSGSGYYLNLQLKVKAPIRAGAVVFQMITLQNQNAKAVEIGREQMDLLIHSCGFKSTPNLDQLKGQVVNAYLTIRKDEEYGDKNAVSRFSKQRDVTEDLSSYPKASKVVSSGGSKSGSGGNSASDDLPF